MSAPQKEKKESIFARLFKRTGDASKNDSTRDDSAKDDSAKDDSGKDDSAKDESAGNKTEGEIIVQEQSVENIPKRRWNSWVSFYNFAYFLMINRKVVLF